MPYKVKIPTSIYTDSLAKLGDSVVNLSKWCEDELSQVAKQFQSTESDFIWNSVPPKPTRGTYAYADGTHWNPGNGEGAYTYDGNLWMPLGNRTPLVVIASGYTVTAADFGKCFYLQNNTNWTLPIAPLASLGNGWWCDFYNAAPGMCTLDPNASEPIDGQLTAGLWPFEGFRLLVGVGSFITLAHSGQWAAWVPSWSGSGGGVPTMTLNGARFKKVRTSVSFYLDATLTAVGTASGYLQFALPIANLGFANCAIFASESALNGTNNHGSINAGTNFVLLRRFDNGLTVVAGARYTMGGTYECTSS